MKHILCFFVIFLLMASACARTANMSTETVLRPHRETNSVYYWKTVFSPDSAELDFLRSHLVGRVYLRMFDVVSDPDGPNPEDRVRPNATVRIDDSSYYLLKDSLAHLEFVPVVYVTLDALKAVKGREGLLAENLTTRVRNMVEYNSLPNAGEIQLDCDWTQATEKSFFRLCDSVRVALRNLNLDWDLSSTVRLHQLSRTAPPVDRGVLMVYNTGSFDNPDARNSIIDLNDIKPYLKNLGSYPLHLDVAYPTYDWQLLFEGRKFLGLTKGLDLNDSTRFTQINEHSFTAKKDFPHNGRIIRAGMTVRSELSEYSEIAAVKRQIEQALSGKPHSNILYHLDSKNLSNYSDDEICNLFTSGR